jgi:hypothetical protein
LSIIRISTNKKTQRFGNWICFRLQARGGAPTLQKNQKLAFPQVTPEQKKLLLKLFADFQAMLLLFILQQS